MPVGFGRGVTFLTTFALVFEIFFLPDVGDLDAAGFPGFVGLWANGVGDFAANRGVDGLSFAYDIVLSKSQTCGCRCSAKIDREKLTDRSWIKSYPWMPLI